MNVQTFLNAFRPATTAGQRRRRPGRTTIISELLESRRMLTGNVDIRFSGSDVYLQGDQGDNSVEVVVDDGNLVIRGLNDTTINGGNAAYTLANGSTTFQRSLIARLSNGNNSLLIGEGVVITRDAVLRSGSGDDTIIVSGATIGRDLKILSGRGSDGIAIHDSVIGNDAIVSAGGMGVIVSISDTEIADDLDIRTGNGDDCIVISNVTVADDTAIRSYRGDDDVVILNSTFGDHLSIHAGRGDDIVYLDSNEVTGRSRLSMESGNDNVVVTGDGIYSESMRIHGGRGSDLAELDAQSTIERLRLRRISFGTVDEELVEERITDDSTGAIAKAESLLDQNAAGVLSMQIAPATVAESAGSDAATLTVSRTGRLSSPLAVTLSNSHPARITIPGTVTIPAGESSIEMSVSTIDNDLADGNITATISAQAEGFDTVTASLTVTDDDLATLTLDVDIENLPEGAGSDAVTFTLSRNSGDVSQPLVVSVQNSAPGRFSVGQTIIIPAGESSTTFTGSPIDNNLVDGDLTVAITASAAAFVSAEASVTVLDDDSPALTASLNVSSVSESDAAGTAVLTVTRNTTDNVSPLTVTVMLSDDSRLSAPASILIPAGAASASADLATIDNDIQDGDLAVTINVTASGFSPGSIVLTIIDDDMPRFTVTPSVSTISEDAGEEAFTITVSLNQVLDEDQTVDLTYTPQSRLLGPSTVLIPAGEESITFPVDVIDDNVPGQDVTVTITASAAGVITGSATVVVEEDDQVTLTIDITDNETVQSSNTVITQDPQFLIRGTTTPGATVSVDRDGDGQFDDAFAVADADGLYELTVTLLHTDVNHGANAMTVRSLFGDSTAAVLALNVHYAVGTVMRFETNVGTWDVELLDEAAPITVANFLGYVESSAYDNLMVHRSVGDFVVQAGGFTVTDSVISSVTTSNPIQNEFSSANSNLRGTLSMAQLSGQPNSGTSQWFISTTDNSFLDAAQHTVFGRVIGTGMLVVDQINDLVSYNLADLYDDGALGEVPLLDFSPGNVQLTGTVSLTMDSALVQGSGTLFTSELQVGDSFQVENVLLFVASIESDTELTLTAESSFTVADVLARTDVVPQNEDFVVFSNIGELLSGI